MTAPRLTVSTALLLLVPPLMWAANAVLGRVVQDMVPPVMLNLLRWLLAFALLLPLAGWVLRPGSGLWTHWRRFSLLGLLSIGGYNTLQYMALQTSTPVNVTLVASSMPVWMLLMGRVLYGVPVTRRSALGAALSIVGVAVVLARGDLGGLLAVRLVPGDALMVLAALVWSWYSWLLARPVNPPEPTAIKGDWAAYLMAQMALGLGWSALLAGAEWVVLPAAAWHIDWSPGLVAALFFFAIGPSLLAYRAWGTGVARVGPGPAVFFANLTPLFAALLSGALLGEWPQAYHALGFVLIVGGILVSARR